MESDKPNRRKFLARTIQSLITISIGTPLLEANAKEAVKKGKFLTEDGKLIELDQEVIDQIAVMPGKKASNSEILNWTKQVKTNRKADE